MFSLFFEITLDRIAHVWGDAKWVKYFRTEYLRPDALLGDNGLTAYWHYGLCSPLQKAGLGIPPWQLPVGQSNKFVKAAIHNTV
eukprot:4096087-Karenia_brevis.AAC.1